LHRSACRVGAIAVQNAAIALERALRENAAPGRIRARAGSLGNELESVIESTGKEFP